MKFTTDQLDELLAIREEGMDPFSVLASELKKGLPPSKSCLDTEFNFFRGELLVIREMEEIIKNPSDLDEAMMYDLLTPYYQMVGKCWAPRERVVVTAIGDAMTPLSAGEIQEITGLPSVSAQLTRLVKEEVLLKHDKRYFIADPHLFGWWIYRNNDDFGRWYEQNQGTISEFLHDTNKGE